MAYPTEDNDGQAGGSGSQPAPNSDHPVPGPASASGNDQRWRPHEALGPVRFDFKWISEAFLLFGSNSGAWIGAGVGVGLLTLAMELLFVAFVHRGWTPPSLSVLEANPAFWVWAVVAFALSVSVTGGMARMAYRAARGARIAASDLFSIGDVLPSLIGCSLLQLLIGLPCNLTVHNTFLEAVLFAWPWVTGGLLIFTTLAIVGEKANPITAIVRSFMLVRRQWLMAIIYSVVVSILSVSGVLLCCVGLLMTWPVSILAVAIAFVRFTGENRRAIPILEPSFDPDAPEGTTPANETPDEARE